MTPVPPNPSDGRPEFLDELAVALSDPSPIPLLMSASTMGYVAIVDPSSRTADGPTGAPAGYSKPPAVESAPLSDRMLGLTSAMIDAADLETDALLLMWASMIDDALLSKRIHRGIDTRTSSLPAWLRELDAVRPVAAVSLRHELGHQETIFVEFDVSGLVVTLAVAVSRLGVPFLEDCYPIADPIAEVRRKFGDDPTFPVRCVDLSLADARANIQEYFSHSDHMLPPVETDSWPATRLLLAWLLRLMPEGGTVEELRDWADGELEALVADFVASPWAAGLGPDAAMHAERLLDFQLSHGSGEPLRWGETAVHMIMADLYPRKIMADADFMLSMPPTLAALVAFANERSGTSAQFTEAALAAIKDELRRYKRRVSAGFDDAPKRSNRITNHSGAVPPEVLRALAELGPVQLQKSGRLPQPGDMDPVTLRLWKDELRLRAGSDEALAALDDVPLPVEDFDPTGIDPALLPRVEKLAVEAARFADTHFGDPELTTVVLRVLAMVARTNPRTFRRGFDRPLATIGLCWIAGKNNRWFQSDVRERTIQEMIVASDSYGEPRQRAKSLLKNVAHSFDGAELDLGDPSLLTSWARAEIIRIRDSLEL